MGKTVHSAGIIPWFKRGDEWYFFVCHAGGPMHKNDPCYMFSKGHIEEGETTLDAAIREFKEETGVDVSKRQSDLRFLGTVKQNANKRVTAFALKMEEKDIDPSKCKSNLTPEGWPEIDKYEWMAWDDLRGITHQKHIVFYEQIIYEIDK